MLNILLRGGVAIDIVSNFALDPVIRTLPLGLLMLTILTLLRSCIFTLFGLHFARFRG